jgi:hypothetical protein
VGGACRRLGRNGRRDIKKPGSLAGRERSGYGRRFTGAAMRKLIRQMRTRGGPKRVTFFEVYLYVMLLGMTVWWLIVRAISLLT